MEKNPLPSAMRSVFSAVPPPSNKLQPFQAQNSLRHAFFGELNNGANASNLTSANVSKSRYVIHLNTLLP